MSNRLYQVNDASIVADLFDNEAIIMNLNCGVYYTLSGTGAEIWVLIQAGHGSDEIVQNLCARYDLSETDCRADVDALVDQLLEKAIIVEVSEPVSGPSPVEVADFGPYVAPDLVEHTDMSDVLAMDPPLPTMNSAAKTSA
ncbi:MAG: PqqD family protein [Pseudomonadota bacterium]